MMPTPIKLFGFVKITKYLFSINAVSRNKIISCSQIKGYLATRSFSKQFWKAVFQDQTTGTEAIF